MKNIFILITLLLLVGCTWNYQEPTVKKNIPKTESKTLEELKLEKQKAEAVIKLIKEDEDKVMSRILDRFLNSEDINIQQELLNTQNRYNDLLGPILEYEHEIIETQTGSTASGVTATGITLSGSIISEQERSDLDKLFNTNTGSVYSGEVKIEEKSEIKAEEKSESDNTIINQDIPEYEHDIKIGNSGTYKSYIGVKDICKGGLKMIKKDLSEKWLFVNTCNKMISSFKLDIGGIKVDYIDHEGNKKEEFVSIN